MVLAIVIYIVVILVITMSLSLFLETLTELVKTSGLEGKRDIIVSVAAICCSYYFFKETGGYYSKKLLDYDYWVFLLVSLLILGIVTAVRETVKSYQKTSEDFNPRITEDSFVEDLESSTK